MPDPATIAIVAEGGGEAGAAAPGGAAATQADAPKLGELLSGGGLARWLRRLFVLGVSFLLFLLLLIVIPILLILGAVAAPAGAGAGTVIPENLPEGARPFLLVYMDAADTFEVNPFVLMALHESESDYSRSTLPGVQTGVNSYGCCAGPMQFDIGGGATPEVGGTGGTWGGYRTGYLRASPQLARPTDAAGHIEAPHPNVYDSFDSIYAAAKYLHQLRATPDLDDNQTLDALTAYRGDARSSAARESAETVIARARELQAASVAALPGAEVGGAGAPPLTTVRGITVNAAIGGQLGLMLAAAEADGVTLTGSGYRSTAEQIALRRQHCGTSHEAIYEVPASSCSPPTARPGTSMHEQGLAIDFAGCTPGSRSFEWLSANAARYGFYNLPSESWHWSVNGR